MVSESVSSLFMYLPQIISLIGCALLVFIAINDVRYFVISNRLNALFLGLSIIFALVTPDFMWFQHLATMAVFFFMGALLFQFRFLGGGDVKLMTTLSFWVGLNSIYYFIIYTALAGGVVSLVYLARAWVQKQRSLKENPDKEFYILAQPVPYGVAIAVGGVYSLLRISVL